ncbi:MAG: aminotransferase class V-fold PLP-dependent enzyme [Cohaesibacteraceae bacterium]|nr:aminotransferase class V-fold PLP-dependent enzyme [Cohaesibacteraceae bacterium]
MILKHLNLTKVINARGVFTPLGVSKSSSNVIEAVSTALSKHVIMEELHEAASRQISQYTGAEAATIVHCTAAAITLTIAATMTGTSKILIDKLPETTGLKSRVILPAIHAVNYGQPIEQAVRLSGAKPHLVGNEAACSIEEISAACSDDTTCCLLLVSSRLVVGDPIDLSHAVNAAHAHGVPVIIDGAAQDFRLTDLLETGADAVLVSGQKCLASPTAGLVIGKSELVEAVRAQDKGIGRGMKASKEAIMGVIAAIEQRQQLDIEAWKISQAEKVNRFVSKANAFEGISAIVVPDPTQLPFERAHLCFDPQSCQITAIRLADAFRAGDPSIWVMDHLASKNELVFELVQLSENEIDHILARLNELVNASTPK